MGRAFLIQVILRLPAEPQRMMYGYRFANTSLRWFFDAGLRSLNSKKTTLLTEDYEQNRARVKLNWPFKKLEVLYNFQGFKRYISI
jgi:hypothetical protein